MGKRPLQAGLVSLILCCAAGQADERIALANEGGIRDAWMLAPGAMLPVPAYPPARAATPAEACVAIGYLLNADGTTSDFALLKAWGAGEPEHDREAYWEPFAQDAANALARWKFAPRPQIDVPKPVYTVATFLFAARDPAELRKRCAIPNLGLRIVELRHDGKAQRRMASRAVFERLDIDPTLEQRYRERQRNAEEASRPLPPREPPPPDNPSQPPPPGGG